MKIVVRGTNWIGDAVMTIPAIRRLRARFPDSHIALHTREWAEDIFRKTNLFDEMITLPQGGNRIASILGAARDLKAHKFDAALIFPNSFESSLGPFLAGIPVRVGYSTQKRGPLLTNKVIVPEWKNSHHESDYYLELVDHFPGGRTGVETTSDEVLIKVSDERRSKARILVERAGGKKGQRLITMGPGSTNSEAKRWPTTSFAKLADLLAAHFDTDIILLGSKAEKGTLALVANESTISLIDLAGTTSLSDAAAIIAESDLFISNDMGLAHISGAVGTNTIVIFGPTNEITTRPLGRTVAVVREPVECAPCMLRNCPIDHRCMTRISPEAVFETALKMLETGK